MPFLFTPSSGFVAWYYLFWVNFYSSLWMMFSEYATWGVILLKMCLSCNEHIGVAMLILLAHVLKIIFFWNQLYNKILLMSWFFYQVQDMFDVEYYIGAYKASTNIVMYIFRAALDDYT
jgi:hypothetical protein